MEGEADAGDEGGVWNPAVILAFKPCAGVDGDDGFALEATRRDTWHGALGDDGADAIFGVDGGLTTLFLVGDVDQEFDEAPVGSLGDMVGEGVDDDAAFAEEGFVVGGVVEVAGEAGVVPDEEGCGAFGFVAGVGDEAVEVVTPCSGASRFGGVFVDAAQGEVVPGAVFFDGFELARNGAVLSFAAAVAQVGVYDGVGGDGGGERS